MSAALDLWKETHVARLSQYCAVRVSGRVSAVRGILLECKIPAAKVGDLCEVSKADGSMLLAEIVGFTQDCTLLSALGAPDGIQVVRPLGIAHRIGVDDSLLGSVLDGFGRPLLGDCLGAFAGPDDRRDTLPVIADALPPTQRPRITRALPPVCAPSTVRFWLGEGQRVGLFAGAGCGKTTLMAELARTDHELDETLRSRSVLVCATSDRSSMERARAAFTATAIAEAFRARGQKVLLLLDSLTRFARAQREIGIEHQRANNRLRQLLAAYKQVEMLLRLGEYQAGADPVTDCAVQLNDAINAFLRQDLREPVPLQETLDELLRLTSQLPE